METTIPTVRIPNDRELDAQERSALCQEFRAEYLRLNPGTNEFLTARAVDDFKRQVVQASPSLRAFTAKQAERQAERDAAVQAEEQRRAAAQQARVDASNEELRQKHLATWLSQGGTEAEFAAYWPTMRLRLLEEATLAERNKKLAGTAQTWRG